MIVNWKGNGVLAVQPIDIAPFVEADAITNHKEREETIRVINKNVKPIILAPGWNDVEDAVWFKCEAHLKDKIDNGQIETMAKEVAEEDGTKKLIGMRTVDFKNRQGVSNGPDVLVKIIKGCNSVGTLEKWLKEESRDEIRFEMKQQLEKLTAPPSGVE